MWHTVGYVRVTVILRWPQAETSSLRLTDTSYH